MLTTSTTNNSTIVVRASADLYLGAPQFQLMVDGKPVGAVQTVTAVHSKGQWQDFTFSGYFGADGPNTVEIVYLNDAFGGAGKDRNLYVDKITVDGTAYQSETDAEYHFKSYTVAGREKLAQAGRLVFDLDGSDPVQTGSSAPVPATSGSTSTTTSGSTSTTTGDDAIVVRASGDQYLGAPQFQLMVDGKAVGAVQTVTALHSKGQWQEFAFKGEFDGADKVEVVFLNDKFGGSGMDRNLYVDWIAVDGKVYQSETHADYEFKGYTVAGREKMSQNGAMVFDISDSDATPEPAPAPTAKLAPSSGSGGTSPGATGKFTVGDDGNIYDPQGHEFVAHGANLFPHQTAWQFLKAIDAWDFNALRLNFVPGMSTMDQVYKAIDTYTAKGIVVMPTWNETAGYMDGPGERQAIVEFFSNLATKYKNNPYVWYGGYNEPGGVNDSMYVNGEWVWDPKRVDKWVDLSRDVIEAVRDAGATGPVLAGTMAQGQDIMRAQFQRPMEEISAVLAHGDRVLTGFDNIVFDVHLYGNYNSKDRLKYLDMFLEEAEDRGIAVVFGEYGSGVYVAKNSPITIQSSRNMAALRDEHDIGDFVWHGQSRDLNDVTVAPGTDAGILNVNNFSNPTNLTELGQIAWEGAH